MPWLRVDGPYEEFKRLLKGYGMTGSRLARVIGKCESTARDRLHNPGSFTLNELRMLNQTGHIPADELKGALKF